MTLTTHVSVGMAVGTIVGNPVAGFFVGLASHHICDLIPHSDPGSRGATVDNIFDRKNRGSLVWVIGDVIVAATIFLAVFLLTGNKSAIFWSVFGATISDFIDNSPLWSQWLRERFPVKQFHAFHEKVHFTIKSKKYFWVGILTQAVLIILSFSLIGYSILDTVY